MEKDQPALSDLSMETHLQSLRETLAREQDSDFWLGQQVRGLRRAKRLSLQQVSDLSGLSIGLLSQIERGITSPSIRSLRALSSALGVAPMWFFNDGKIPPPEERGRIVRRGGGRVLRLPTKGITKELLCPDLSGTLELLLVVIAPKGSSGPDAYTHEGEDAGYVLSGNLELWVGPQRYRLGAGDSFRFPATMPHRFSNPGRAEARVLWVVTPPIY